MDADMSGLHCCFSTRGSGFGSMVCFARSTEWKCVRVMVFWLDDRTEKTPSLCIDI